MARRWLDLGATALAAVLVAVVGLALNTETPDVRPDQTRSDPSSSSATPANTSGDRVSESGDARIVGRDAVIGIRLDQTLTTETARTGDLITAHVSRDVVVDNRTAIPSGTVFEGVVTLVERGAPASGRARIGIRFNALVLPDHTRLAIHTDTISRENDPVSEPASARGAGAALGAMLSGGGRNDAIIHAGSSLTVKLTAPLVIRVKKDREF
jgi:hypothetical protein